MGSMGEPEVEYTDVLIIGAGFGAFTVLNRLRRQGYDVTVFEKGTAAGGSKLRRSWKLIERRADSLIKQYGIGTAIQEVPIPIPLPRLCGVVNSEQLGWIARIQYTSCSIRSKL